MNFSQILIIFSSRSINKHKHLFLNRDIGKLKRMVKNKARVEGSICQAYLMRETTYFTSYYFEDHVPSMRTRSRRNEEVHEPEGYQPSLSIFRVVGNPGGKTKTRFLSYEESHAAHLHVLLNCVEVEPYLK